MYQAGLILEGGGMKGVYTAGVLDFFLDKGISFQACYGVSAGACIECSFLSKQRGRAYRTYTDYLDDKRYCSLYSLITTGDLFGAKFCYDDIPNRLLPYDYDTFNEYRGKAYVVVTNVDTGEAEYLPLKEMHRDIIAVRASASLPLVSRKVRIHGSDYLDGGVADSIPLARSIADGNVRNVVILTKEADYVRTPMKHRWLFRLFYGKKKAFVEQMLHRHTSYNEALALIEREEAAGRTFVIRPTVKNDIGRTEKNPAKLEALYKQGYADGQASYEQLIAFLESAGTC